MTNDDIKVTPEIKSLAKEYLEECPYLPNIKKAQSEWAEIWENFCPRGGSVQYFSPDNDKED